MRFIAMFLALPLFLFACSTDESVNEDTATECSDDDTAVDTGDSVDTGDTSDTGDSGSDTGDTAIDPVDTGSDTGSDDTGAEDTGSDTAETPPA